MNRWKFENDICGYNNKASHVQVGFVRWTTHHFRMLDTEVIISFIHQAASTHKIPMTQSPSQLHVECQNHLRSEMNKPPGGPDRNSSWPECPGEPAHRGARHEHRAAPLQWIWPAIKYREHTTAVDLTNTDTVAARKSGRTEGTNEGKGPAQEGDDRPLEYCCWVVGEAPTTERNHIMGVFVL